MTKRIKPRAGTTFNSWLKQEGLYKDVMKEKRSASTEPFYSFVYTMQAIALGTIWIIGCIFILLHYFNSP